MPAYAVVIREKARNPAKFGRVQETGSKPVSRSTRLNFSPFMAALKFSKAPRTRTLLSSNSPASKRRKPGITARNIRLPASIASKAGTIVASSPTVWRPNDRCRTGFSRYSESFPAQAFCLDGAFCSAKQSPIRDLFVGGGRAN